MKKICVQKTLIENFNFKALQNFTGIFFVNGYLFKKKGISYYCFQICAKTVSNFCRMEKKKEFFALFSCFFNTNRNKKKKKKKKVAICMDLLTVCSVKLLNLYQI